MRPETFELFKKYGFSQITFFRAICTSGRKLMSQIQVANYAKHL